jgi:hypothetical protein
MDNFGSELYWQAILSASIISISGSFLTFNIYAVWKNGKMAAENDSHYIKTPKQTGPTIGDYTLDRKSGVLKLFSDQI